MAITGAKLLRIPTWSEVLTSPDRLRRVVNVWPPYRFAGIRVERIAPDWSSAVVSLGLNPANRNYVGTQFGGSMFSMTDPFFMLLLMNLLGRDYVVWDQRGEIEYLRPGRTRVRATMTVDEATVAEIRAAAASGEKVLRWFETDIVDTSGEVVARVRRQLYIRRARPATA